MVIAAKNVPRWVQPAPTTTTGDALIFLTGDPQAKASGTATAAVTITAPAAAITVATGTASIIYVDTLAVLPLVNATAQIAFNNTAKAEDHLGVAAAIALAAITAPATTAAVINAPVTLLIVARLDTAPTVSGTAVVAMNDFGQGSKPLLPFTLPVRLTDNLLDVQDAAADVRIVGDAVNGGAAGFADATVQITSTVPLTIQGRTPIFPFSFPIVFTDTANVKTGLALVTITAPGELAAKVYADAQAAIVAESIQVNPAVLPLLLPVVFT
jgi:hypothetical protein